MLPEDQTPGGLNTQSDLTNTELSASDVLRLGPGSLWLGARWVRLERSSVRSDGRPEVVAFAQDFVTPWLGLGWQPRPSPDAVARQQRATAGGRDERTEAGPAARRDALILEVERECELGTAQQRDAARIQGPVLEALGELPADRLFFEVMIRFAEDVATARDLSQRLGLCPTTLTSRFSRVGLPSPKSYLAATRLLYAVLLFERPGFTVADVAYRLDYSSPKSFGRHVRSLLGITGTELRRRVTFTVALERYVASLIRPYREIWSTFHPLGQGGRLRR